MGMMQKMRSLTPVFIIGVGGLFILFMVLSDTRVLEVLGQSKNVVGSVNGEKITYEEYNKAIENMREQIKNQYGQDVDEDRIDILREQAWDQLVTQKLLEQQMEQMKIEVTDKEVEDYLFGPNPPVFLRQQFTDSTGRFRRDIYMQALKDPRNKQIVENLKIGLKEELKQQKLITVLGGSVVLSEGELLQNYKNQNIFANVEYLVVRPEDVADNLIKVTDNDLKQYYEKNQYKYRYDEQRKLKVVVFPKQPTADDSTSAFSLIDETKKLITSDTTSLKNFENPFTYKKDTLDMGKLSSEALTVLNSASLKQVVGPVKSQTGYALYRLLGKTTGKETFVRAAHILVDDEATANQLYERVNKGDNFAQLAQQYSKDPGSAHNGGDLGWFGKGRMVPEFENACFSGPVGKVQKPVKTNYGYHVILVKEKSNARFIVEELESPIKLSGASKDLLYEKAADFQYFADKNSFDEAVKHFNMKQYEMETPLFTKNQAFIPGVGYSKFLVDWSFENGKGDISSVISTPNAYVVAIVTDVKEAGVKPFDELKAVIKSEVVRNKKLEYGVNLLKGVKSKIGANDSLSVVYGNNPLIKRGVTGRFSYQSYPPNVGYDIKFTHNVMEAKTGSVIGPFKGRTGAYIVKVWEKDQFDKNAYKMQRRQIASNLYMQKSNEFIQNWLANIKEKAEIKDERYKFYR